MYHDRCNIFELQVDTGRNCNAELLQHVLDTLYREGCLAGLITCTIKAYHEAVSNKLIVSDPCHAGQILDSLSKSLLADHDE